MRFTVVATEVMSIMALLLILYGSIFEINRRIKKNGVYIVQVVLCILALVADMIAWIVDGTSTPSGLIFLSDLMTFILGYAIIVSYNVYIVETLREKRPVSPMVLGTVFALLAVAIVFVVWGSLVGKVFTIENHCYVTGPWYKYTQIFTEIVLITNLYLILSNRKLYGLHDTFALLSYVFFPVLATVLHYVVPQISLTFIGSMFSQFMVYIMLQAEQEKDFREKERIMFEISHTDTLTGLQNRRAYVETLDRLKNETNVGVLFLDINGLKYTNDHFGHKAGDELISGVAGIISKHFAYKDIYRISGDEFVVISAPIREKDLERKANSFQTAQARDGKPVAAFGICHGKGEEIKLVVKEAETRMYENKESFYRNYPEMRGR